MALGTYGNPHSFKAFAFYARAAMRRRQADERFMEYVANSLHLQGKGQYIATPYTELAHPREDFDRDEVIARICAELDVIE